MYGRSKPSKAERKRRRLPKKQEGRAARKRAKAKYKQHCATRHSGAGRKKAGRQNAGFNRSPSEGGIARALPPRAPVKKPHDGHRVFNEYCYTCNRWVE